MKCFKMTFVITAAACVSVAAPALGQAAGVEELLLSTKAIVQTAGTDGLNPSAKTLLARTKQLTSVAQEISAKKIAGLPRLASMRFRDLRSRHNFKGGKNLLLLAGGGTIRELHNSILLVDGTIDVSFASSSLIIATGGVEIAHGSENIVIAGHYLHVSHDGSFDPSNKATKRKSSLLLSRNIIDVSHATRSVVSTPGKLSIAHAHRVVGVNIVNSDISFRNDMTDVASERFSISLNPFTNLVSNEVLYYPPTSTEDDYATGELCFASETPFILPASKIVSDCCGTVTRNLSGWKQVGAFNYSLFFSRNGEVAEVKVEPEPETTPRICNFTDVPQTQLP